VIVLIGFMGAGKTTVGRLLAHELRTDFVDADDAIEERAALPVADIFESRGEGEFRRLERATVADLVRNGEGVVALGGGALGDEATRKMLGSRRDLTVVYLAVDHDEALRRIGPDRSRPMLTFTDARGLHERRRATYETAASVTIETTGRTPQRIVREIVETIDETSGHLRPATRRVTVPMGPRAYDVLVGAGLAGRLGELIPEVGRAEKAFVVTHPELLELAERVAESTSTAGLKTDLLDIPSGEMSKSLDVVSLLYDRLGHAAAHRADIVVGVGGGVVTDVAGFVASTFNRGMPVVQVATTLLGQVDAAVGGKTGINLSYGKNLVGTFYHPTLVVCDVDVLGTLPEEEIRAGLAEVIKYGFIASPDLLHLVERNAEQILQANPRVMVDIVGRSVQIKASVVAGDEREEGERALLNYGHTFAHAIEQTVGYGRIRHGEAVAVGMMAAAHLGRVLDRFDEQVVEAHRTALGAVGLPVTASLDVDVLERAWLRDKKFLHGVRFVLLTRIGEAEAGVTAPRAAVVEALERLSG
jgi:shikimate kinase / 3-dehydroquinate synthase